MTIAVDLGRKATKQTNKQTKHMFKLMFGNIKKFCFTGLTECAGKQGGIAMLAESVDECGGMDVLAESMG